MAERSSPLLEAHRFLRRGPVSAEGWSQLVAKNRDWERSYRERWAHDKVVRSTHGVNCTGSCSWNVYVKEGLITWESQAVDYPSTGPEMPEYEPRGCPRGASFSWYTYSPLRLRYPYVRGSLIEMFRDARSRLGDPVEAWAEIVDDPDRSRQYKRERGKGGFVRASWDEVVELIAAAHVHTIKRYGPDRVVGFSPIPAMSMASYAAGTRFLSLIGGVILSFYDWYADLPPSSPQVFGDQTDVPESGDWWNADYLIIWGTNLPTTRTPDAHFMVEARYRGQKVVVVSPDYAEHTKFADHWLAAEPGSDGALAMAMGHVILKEFYVDRDTPYFRDYARRFTDLPLLVTLRERDGAHVPDRLLRASDLGGGHAEQEHADWKTVVLDERTGEPAVPNGSVGHRYAGSDEGRWNLRLDGVEPALTLLDLAHERVAIDLPRFDVGESEGGSSVRRGVPAMRIGGKLVTTVLDLALAQYGVAREGLPGDWPAGYDDAEQPCTPAWQEQITGVDRHLAARVAREFARNAEVTKGRSMICMGAGTNHWFHSDQAYRTFLALVMMCGCEGRNGGGWAHYVGQEKVRPLTGWQTVAFALDWVRPPRHQSGTPFFYVATGQWRYERIQPEHLASPLGRGLLAGRHILDVNALGARLGWLPSYPSFDRSTLELVDEAEGEGIAPAEYVVRGLRSGALRFACEDPDAPQNHPKVMTVWRSNLLGSSGKGHEYFLKHLLGVPDSAVRAEETPLELRPREVVWRDPAPEGKLDLLTTIDFRMTSNALFSDVVLPAATWYEKYDLSSTDLHPFVHAFNEAIAPPWEAKSDWDAFHRIAVEFSRLAERHLGSRRDLVAAPLLHDTPDEIAQPLGEVRDWKAGDCEPVPGRTMPKLLVLERDYPNVGERWAALGPLLEQLGSQTKGAAYRPSLHPLPPPLPDRHPLMRHARAADAPDRILDAIPPASGAVVMGTGIVSIGLSLDGQETLSLILLVFDAAIWIALAVLLPARALRDRARFRIDARTPAALTSIAGTAVLGTRLTALGWVWAGAMLLAVALLIWLALVPYVLRHWQTPTVGTSFILTVATESLALLAATLAFSERATWLLYAALVPFCLGLGFYVFVLARFQPRQLVVGLGDHWVTGGALAISTVTAGRITLAAQRINSLSGAHGALKTIALVLWWLTIAWLPALLAAEAIHPRLFYNVRRWSTVFPVGMYAACSFVVGAVTGTAAITQFARVWVWVGVAVWITVFLAMLSRAPRLLVGSYSPR